MSDATAHRRAIRGESMFGPDVVQRSEIREGREQRGGEIR